LSSVSTGKGKDLDAITKHKMTLTLPSDVEFRMTRTFDAPAALVFRAWTDAKHLPQWYGCGMAGLTKCDVDLTVNGGYRYTMHPSGAPVGTIFGVYREIAAPERLIYTQGFVTDGFLSPNCLVTVTFVEENGRTTLTSSTVHSSKADRDAHLASGVERGAAASFDALEAHVRTMG
jgi:uncharacterized protein YndB with AHSA1/START domain